MNILEVKQFDVVNGPGIRCSIWTAGCENHCDKCWSPHTWNPNLGKSYKDSLLEIMEKCRNPHVEAISILGGDPFFSFIKDKDLDIFDLLTNLHTLNKPIWLWTGYTIDYIIKKCKENNTLNQLNYLTTIIDGPFINSKKDMTLYWRGSSNQRIIQVKDYLKKLK